MGGGYQTVSGTSPATPHVAGTAARCLASGACRGLAPAGAFCASLAPGRQEALRLACFHRLGDPAGPFTLQARAWYAVGHV